MRRFTVVAVALAVGIGAAASPFASSEPDGLERVAKDEKFAMQAEGPGSRYGDERLETGLAGFAGTLGAFGLAAGVGAARRRRSHVSTT